MRVTHYQRLSPEPGQGGVPGAGAARATAWAALRRAAAGVARLYAARRRWAARRLWGGARGRVAVGRRPLRAARYDYDSASYARNFDDGSWMAEEGLSWHGRSLAACRVAAAVVH